MKRITVQNTSRHARHLRAVWLTVLCVPVLLALSSPGVFAQREQAGIRYETYGATTLKNVQVQNSGIKIDTLAGQRLNGQEYSNSVLMVNAGFQSSLDNDGSTLLTNSIGYRNVRIGLPVQRSTQVAATALNVHFLAYEGTLLRTLSDKFQLVANVRAGVFSDMKNVDVNHLRIEPTAFLDYFVSDELTLGLGFAYQTSNFGRLISVPVLHVFYIGGSEFLIDGILPSKIDFWYYPSKTWEIGLNVGLYGSQFRLGERPVYDGVYMDGAEQINTLMFANATAGPMVRYNLFEKAYLSAEGGYTVTRRAILGDSNRNSIIDFAPGGSWFTRIGIQWMY
ncbi:MAG: hypothetical protein JNL32_02045 [Candidatus Kapabacteria bacterium]|nr:hypothetical protein [Candidatus Kapabacteria bacterium]